MRQPGILPGTKVLLCLLAVMLGLFTLSKTGRAEVIRQDDGELARELHLPVTEWKDPSRDGRGVVLAIHGLVMHGGSFDTLARSLCGQGFVVAAPDMRGYGRWQAGDRLFPANEKVSYDDSERDTVCLLTRLRASYPHQPIFCVGESLGADIAIRAAASHPELVDGLVLSSPAIKRRTFFIRRTFTDLAHLWTLPNRQLDLTTYIKKRASEDPKIIQGMLDDPLVRKHLSSYELLKSQLFLHATLKYVQAVPADIPVLIIQGDADRLLKSNAVVLLLERLKSKDQTIRWFHERGHILLETPYIKPDTLETVQGWLVQHAKTQANMRAAEGDKEPLVRAD